MKINDDHLDRLLKAARPASEHADLPFGTQTRILAGWRSGQNSAAAPELLRLFQMGLACACVLVLIIAAASLRELNQRQPPSLVVQDAVINLAFTK